MFRRNTVSSNSPFESDIGFSRAVRHGNLLVVSGTAPLNSDGSTAFPGDLYNQTRQCLTIIKEAIEKSGAELKDVIRTRVMLTDISQWESAGKAHGEFFREIRPACTFVEVSRFISPDWLVEIEADCYIG